MDKSLPRKVSSTQIGQGPQAHEQLFYFAAACGQYECVVLDRSSTTYGLGSAAKESPAGTDDNPEVLGLVQKAVAAGTWAPVLTYGVGYVKMNANMDAGDPVCADTAAAGQVREYVEGTDGNRVGFALEAEGTVTLDNGSTITGGRIFVQLGG